MAVGGQSGGWAAARRWAIGLACALAAMPATPQAPPKGPPPEAFVSVAAAWTPRQAAHQQALLAKALDALSPQRPGKRDVYVLAAGLWSDPVFDREAKSAAAILAQRYGAQGRAVVLTQGEPPGTAGLPAATSDHLFAALGRIGQRLDPKEDLLILFVTSHGDEKGLALRDAGRMQALLTPQALRLALDDAGFINRVVIISACHSGVFIPALRTPNSAVVTAAAAERKSFGCRPENEWTYFGDAFFNQSMSRGRGLEAAFSDARTLVQLWERRDRETPSDPQIHIGETLGPYLAAIE